MSEDRAFDRLQNDSRLYRKYERLSVLDLMGRLEAAENALAPFAAIGGLLNMAGTQAMPDGVSASRLKLDGLLAVHFREAQRALAKAVHQEKRSPVDLTAGELDCLAKEAFGEAARRAAVTSNEQDDGGKR